jgi:hypothetical protein
MKHLRRFSAMHSLLEQSNESLKEELQDFCDTHLAYLIDEGFKVRISKFEGDDYHQIMLGCATDGSGYGNNNRLWSEMKDQVLPFLHFLFKDYELYYDNNAEPAMGIVYRGSSGIKQEELKLDQVDDLPDNTEISTLFIRVVKKEDKEVKKSPFRNF